MRILSCDELVTLLGRWSGGRGALYLLLAARLRLLIDEGQIRAGTTLPTDRALALALAVGRSTIISAYDVLRQEGRIVRRQGSGTQVADTRAPSAPTGAEGSMNTLFLHLMEPSDDIVQLGCAAPTTPPPELAEAYRSAVDRFVGDVGADIGYHPAGLAELRAAIARSYTARGVPTGPEQVMITTGAQQALALITSTFLTSGNGVVCETPSYPGALELFREAGAVISGAECGPAGLDHAEFLRLLARDHTRLGYLIPTHQNPTGAVLPPLVRRRIVLRAAELGVPLVEDETLAELGFHDLAPPPLASYAPDGDILTVGSLSKLVWGGLRVGWVRAPASRIARLARVKALHDMGSPVLAQRAVLELLPHLPQLRARRVAELRVCHDRLRERLAERLPDWTPRPVTGGQTLWVRLPHGSASAFAQIALRQGIALLAGPGFSVRGDCDDHLRIPFLRGPDELTAVVDRLAEMWQKFAANRPSTVIGEVLTPPGAATKV
ncbi:aminotransferase-like domain-containing protein [Allokutzneria albata]|uniref:DNA-binding transcriptional regulator, MocR family, contains an aminotransferase domain n=1 Tax=Allokutzneria albata TaxID=211114 RepID=A0A1G9WGQ6_ALLAB|nr:PLP-dependent aminotransferase family protein [Allokutzneria albata]SDM83391.1 DNA-binding transcriptional regulator, MocR family, contains an aminotransferase domain [Allokutzneria albata]